MQDQNNKTERTDTLKALVMLAVLFGFMLYGGYFLFPKLPQQESPPCFTYETEAMTTTYCPKVSHE